MKTETLLKDEAQKDLEALKRGTLEIISEAELLEKLISSKKENRPLIIKLGLDPTAPVIHLGFAVVLRKLRQFQDMGHKVMVIIGDYTARIGDPTGRSETRPQLTPQEIEANAAPYREQLGKILDLAKTEIVFNSQWFSVLTFAQVLDLTRKYTVARLLERDDFAQRYSAGQALGLHDLLFPLMQGYDSVMLRSDVELGGTDQKFNILVGRDLQREFQMPPQIAMLLPILEGTDGKLKMSKSYKNYIGISDPPAEMFGKLMSLPDHLMEKYLVLTTNMPLDEIEQKIKGLEKGEIHPRQLKKELAEKVVEIYHGKEAAREASAEFERVFRDRETPSEMPEYALTPEDLKNGKIWIVKLLDLAGLADSKKEAGRLIAQGAVSVDSDKVGSADYDLSPKDGMILKVGSRKFMRIRFSG